MTRSTQVVDVVIPFHDPSRSVERAVRSATCVRQGVETNTIVVVHNTTLKASRRRDLEQMAHVVDLHDGIPSPSGPRNLGIRHTCSPFVFMLDSDDQLADGCLARCLQVAQQTGAGVVLPSIMIGNRFVSSPLTTSRSLRLLDLVRDQLFLRSNAPALFRRAVLLERDAPYPLGVATGEDFVLMSELFARVPTALAFDAVYLAAKPEPLSTSTAALPVAKQLEAVHVVATASWVDSLSDAERESLVVRMLRINLADAWRRRCRRGEVLDGPAYATARDSLVRLSPLATQMLSVRDRLTLRFDDWNGGFGWFDHPVFGVVPTSGRGFYSPRGPLAMAVRTQFVRRRRRRRHRARYEPG